MMQHWSDYLDTLRDGGKVVPEDKSAVLPRALERAKEMDRSRLARAVQDFGSARAERLLVPVLGRA